MNVFGFKTNNLKTQMFGQEGGCNNFFLINLCFAKCEKLSFFWGALFWANFGWCSKALSNRYFSTFLQEKKAKQWPFLNVTKWAKLSVTTSKLQNLRFQRIFRGCHVSLFFCWSPANFGHWHVAVARRQKCTGSRVNEFWVFSLCGWVSGHFTKPYEVRGEQCEQFIYGGGSKCTIMFLPTCGHPKNRP